MQASGGGIFSGFGGVLLTFDSTHHRLSRSWSGWRPWQWIAIESSDWLSLVVVGVARAVSPAQIYVEQLIDKR